MQSKQVLKHLLTKKGIQDQIVTFSFFKNLSILLIEKSFHKYYLILFHPTKIYITAFYNKKWTERKINEMEFRSSFSKNLDRMQLSVCCIGILINGIRDFFVDFLFLSLSFVSCEIIHCCWDAVHSHLFLFKICMVIIWKLNNRQYNNNKYTKYWQII